MTAAAGLPVLMPAAALDLWLELLAAASSAGARVPCRADPEVWWPRCPDAAAAAVEGCLACPLRVQCREYALAAGERYGVWGGLTPADRKLLGAW